MQEVDEDVVYESDPLDGVEEEEVMYCEGDEDGAKMVLRKVRKVCSREVIFVSAVSLIVILSLIVGALTFLFIEILPSDHHSYPGVFADHGAVSSEVGICSDMGLAILKQGGNAVDASVTTCLCVGLVNSFSSGIGGGGVLLFHSNQKNVNLVYDFRETAPNASYVDMFGGDARLAQIGGMSVAVPAELRGLEIAHQQHGVLPWSALLDPVIALAEKGFRISEILAEKIKKEWDDMDDGMRMLFGKNGKPLGKGALLKRPQLAKTLRAVSGKAGTRPFYTGDVAAALVHDVQEAGGILTMQDMQFQYDAGTRVYEPMSTFFFGHEVFSPPPPFGGSVLLMILNLLEGYDMEKLGISAQAAHWLAETMKFAYGDRMGLGDPDFVAEVRDIYNVKMLDKRHAAILRQRLSPDRTFDVEHYQDLFNVSAPASNHGTTHISIIDKDRNAVGLTSTVNLYFGSKVRSKSTGVILNDEMDDFSSPGITNAFNLPPSPPNYIAPRKKPLSSMSPTIMLKNGEVALVVGASGGSIIPTATLQTLLNVLVYEMDMYSAIVQPRVHCQLIPEVVLVEDGMSSRIVDGLKERGHRVEKSKHLAIVQGVRVVDGRLDAASDPRKDGRASGY